MVDLKQLELQYVTNEAGEKMAVIIPFAEFQLLIEDLKDLAAVAERRDESTAPHDELLVELGQDRLIYKERN